MLIFLRFLWQWKRRVISCLRVYNLKNFLSTVSHYFLMESLWLYVDQSVCHLNFVSWRNNVSWFAWLILWLENFIRSLYERNEKTKSNTHHSFFFQSCSNCLVPMRRSDMFLQRMWPDLMSIILHFYISCNSNNLYAKWRFKTAWGQLESCAVSKTPKHC